MINFWDNSYIEYENNDDRNKNLLAEEHLDHLDY